MNIQHVQESKWKGLVPSFLFTIVAGTKTHVYCCFMADVCVLTPSQFLTYTSKEVITDLKGMSSWKKVIDRFPWYLTVNKSLFKMCIKLIPETKRIILTVDLVHSKINFIVVARGSSQKLHKTCPHQLTSLKKTSFFYV